MEKSFEASDYVKIARRAERLRKALLWSVIFMVTATIALVPAFVLIRPWGGLLILSGLVYGIPVMFGLFTSGALEALERKRRRMLKKIPDLPQDFVNHLYRTTRVEGSFLAMNEQKYVTYEPDSNKRSLIVNVIDGEELGDLLA